MTLTFLAGVRPSTADGTAEQSSEGGPGGCTLS